MKVYGFRKKKIILLIFVLVFTNLASTVTFAQDGSNINLEEVEEVGKVSKTPINIKNESKLISLKDVLEEGLRMNSEEQTRRFQKEILEINWSDDYKKFWYPQLNFTIKTEETLVDNLYGDVEDNEGTSKTPAGSAGLEFDNYTVFNWGKDYLDYQNNQATFKRQKQILSEKKRDLRFEIIANYFSLIRKKKISRAYKVKLRQASFIYRLAKEKFSLKKVRSQHFLQAKSEFLKAHQEFQNSIFFVTEAEENLAKSIGDDIDTSYSPLEELKFKTLTTLKDVSYKFARDRNPNLLTAKTNLSNANRSFQKALKENMPLPKFDLKFGALKHNFSSAGANDTFESSPGNKNAEIVASINMKWTIFGSGGLFNSNLDKKAYLNKRISEIQLRESKRELKVLVHTLHRKVRSLEKRFEASRALVKNIKLTFDKTLDNYIAGKTTFPDIKLTLELLTNAHIDFEDSKFEHLFYKLELAKIMGVDDFPGERFEGLVIR
jgi:outer membrane protein TolC